MPGPEEFFDIVDERDEVIGRAPRRICHGNPALIHRAVHVLVFSTSGELLLQKRSPAKDIQPGKWDTSVGGHLEAGESYLAAARREMAEELGLQGLALAYLYPSQLRNSIESENVATFLAITEGAVDFDSSEITEVRYWSGTEIDRALGTGVFTPNFEDEWRMLQAHVRRAVSGGPAQQASQVAGISPEIWGTFIAGQRFDL